MMLRITNDDTKDEKCKHRRKTKVGKKQVLPDVHLSQLETQSTLRTFMKRFWRMCTKTPLRQQGGASIIFTVLLILYIIAHPDSVKVGANSMRKEVQSIHTILLFVLVTLQWIMATQLPEWRQHALLLFSAKILTFVIIAQITEVVGFAKTVEVRVKDNISVYHWTTEPVILVLPLIMFTMFFNLWGRFYRAARIISFSLIALSLIGLTGAPHVYGMDLDSPWKILTGIVNVASVGFLLLSAIFTLLFKHSASLSERLLYVILIVMVGGTKLFCLSLYWGVSWHPLYREDNAVLLEAIGLLDTICWCFVLPLTLVWGKICALQTASLKAEVSRRENLRHRFFRWIFHEVRVPLNNIYLILQEFTSKILPHLPSDCSEPNSTISSEGELSEFSENVKSCLEEARSLTRTLDSVKDFDMVSSDKINLDLGQFNLIKMYSKLCQAISLRYRNQRISLDLTTRLSDSENDLCFRLRQEFGRKETKEKQKRRKVSPFRDVKVIGDATRIETAISAVLDNAFRFGSSSDFSSISFDVDISVKPNTGRRKRRSSTEGLVATLSNTVARNNRRDSDGSHEDSERRSCSTPNQTVSFASLNGSKAEPIERNRANSSCDREPLTHYLEACPYVALLTFVISDSGGGIPEQAVETIFEPFANLSPGSRGSGLSLCISKAMVEAHDGSINVESEKGVGSTFTIVFSLPCMGTESAEIDKLREETCSFRNTHETYHDEKNDKQNDTGIPSLRAEEEDGGKRGEAANSVQSVNHTGYQGNENSTDFKGSDQSDDSDSTSKPFGNAPPSEIDTSSSHKGFKADSNPNSVTPTSALGTDTKRCTVERVFLVVDDVKTTCKLLKRGILRKMPNSTVEVAYDGREAINLVRSRGISYFTHITMDKEMPNMDGYQAASKLRQMGYSGTIVGVTGNALSADVQRFLQKGADFVMTKPLDLGEFANKLDGEAGGLEGAVAEQLPEFEAHSGINV